MSSNPFVIGGTDPNKSPQSDQTWNPAPAPAPAGAQVIQKRAGVNDAYDGGLKVLRDTTGLEGGTPGYVNTANFTRTIAGYGVTAFEWATVSIVDNHAVKGENVATYMQANKHAVGPTWAGCSEVCDTEGRAGLAVSHEFDVWTTGPDNGERVGLWPVLGDSREIRGLGPSDTVGGSDAIRIEARPRTLWTRGIRFVGKFLVGIDFSTAESIQTPIRLKAGQSISFDEYDSFQLRRSGERIQFCAYGQPVLEIDMRDGSTYRRGIKA